MPEPNSRYRVVAVSPLHHVCREVHYLSSTDHNLMHSVMVLDARHIVFWMAKFSACSLCCIKSFRCPETSR